MQYRKLEYVDVLNLVCRGVKAGMYGKEKVLPIASGIMDNKSDYNVLLRLIKEREGINNG